MWLSNKIKKKNSGLNLGLRGEFVFQFVLIALIPLLLASLIAYTYGKQALEKTIGQGLVQVAQEKLDQADHSIALRIETIYKYIETIRSKVALANSSTGQNEERPTDLQLLESNNLLRDDVRQLEGYAGPNSQIVITNAHRQIIQASNIDTFFSMVEDGWWDRAFNNNLGYDVIEDITFDEKRHQLTIALPIRDQMKKNVLGILKATLVLPELVDLVKDSTYGRKATDVSTHTSVALRTVIIDQYGRIIAAPISSKYIFGDHIDQSDAAMAAIIAATSQNGEYYNYQMRAERADLQPVGDKNLMALQTEPQVYGWARTRTWQQRWPNQKMSQNFSKWTVLVFQPASVAFEGITQLTRRILNFTMVSCVAIIPIAWVVSLRIVTPIMQVVDGVRAVGQGKFDLKIPVTTGNELGLLAEEFNAMRSNLESAVENLRQEEQKMTAIVNSLSEGLIVIDSQNCVLHINPTAERLLNIPHGAQNRELSQVIQDEALIEALQKGARHTTGESLTGMDTDNAYKLAATDPLVGVGGKIMTTEISLHNSSETEVTKDGQIILRVITAPYLDENGAILGSVYVFENVTRKKEIDQMKSDFISLVSHELRTPLTSIIGFVSLVLEGKTGALNQRQTDSLSRVQRQSKRLATLINDLLDISRIEAGRAEFKHHSISMIDIIKDRIGDLRLQADEKSIRLHLIGATELPSVCGDEERIGQVLTNLIGNAIKFTPDKGIVSIRVNIPDQVGNVSDNNTVHIEVIDTGAGVPVEERQKVFDKFYQKSNIHTRQEGGTGLGLAIAKGIIEAHGGNLWIGDGENGVGSNFQFTLPI